MAARCPSCRKPPGRGLLRPPRRGLLASETKLRRRHTAGPIHAARTTPTERNRRQPPREAARCCKSMCAEQGDAMHADDTETDLRPALLLCWLRAHPTTAWGTCATLRDEAGIWLATLFSTGLLPLRTRTPTGSGASRPQRSACARAGTCQPGAAPRGTPDQKDHLRARC